MFAVDDLCFDAQGLIPAVVQDATSGDVLMVAYMNKESLGITMAEQQTCFYSRSRQILWRKGETSGNTQQVVSIATDCDADTLLIKVNKKGPACHTGAESCFFNQMFEGQPAEDAFSLQSLYNLIEGRKTNLQEGSYTSYLFNKGAEKILKKVGEECTEVVIAAMKQDNQETVFEIADLCYHIMVLMAERGITVDEVKNELASRHVVDHKVKQETLQ